MNVTHWLYIVTIYGHVTHWLYIVTIIWACNSLVVLLPLLASLTQVEHVSSGPFHLWAAALCATLSTITQILDSGMLVFLPSLRSWTVEC